jgi:hypothetical protein
MPMTADDRPLSTDPTNRTDPTEIQSSRPCASASLFNLLHIDIVALATPPKLWYNIPL